MVKNWILKLPIVRDALLAHGKDMYDFAVKNTFADAQKDILETMRDDLDKQAEMLAEQKLNELLSNADLNFVVSLDKAKGILYIGGERADELRLTNLKAEAEFLIGSELWRLLYETPKELAQKAMFVEGENLEKQLAKGRTILYTLSTQKRIIDLLTSYTPKD